MLSERQIRLLKVIIDDFIQNDAPVGSKVLKNNHDLPYSSATIRNDMACLEEEGLLEKTHTSSGRIPSNKGYRYYVDNLIDENDLSQEIIKDLERIFNNRKLELDEVIKEACNLISKMTNYTSVALGSDSKEEIISKIEVVPLSHNSIVLLMITHSGKVEHKTFSIKEDMDLQELKKCVKIINNTLVGTRLQDVTYKINNEIRTSLEMYVQKYEDLFEAFMQLFMNFEHTNIYVSGKHNVINQPQFNDVTKIKKFLNIIEDYDFFGSLAKNVKGLSITIGQEKNTMLVDDLTIVTSNYEVSPNEKGIIAVIGPKRMDYDKVISMLDYTAKKISELFNETRGDNGE
jgi:heat-inducible transcriptional repressor